MKGRRGSALTQVLVMAAIAATVAAGVIQLAFSTHMAAYNDVRRASDDMKTRAALNVASEVWARSAFCSSDSAAGLSCNAQSCGSCSCTFSDVALTSRVEGGACRLQAVVSEP